MAESPKRATERLSCDLEASLHVPTTGAPIGPARLIDLGVGGAQVETMSRLQRSVSYELRFAVGSEALAVPARVSWEAKRDEKANRQRFGLLFTLTTTQEQRLRALLDALRVKLWGGK